MNEIIQRVLKKRANLDFTLEEQEAQYEALRKAQELGEMGRHVEAIKIAEKIMYEEGCLCMGVSWPFVLSDLYLKNNMNNDCWKYLNFISVLFPAEQDKIDDLRVKVLKQEGKHRYAMAIKMRSILFKYSKVEVTPTIEKVEKDLTPFIKRANMIENKTELISLMNKYLYTQPYELNSFWAEIKKIING